MKKITVEGREYSVPDAVATYVHSLKKALAYHREKTQERPESSRAFLNPSHNAAGTPLGEDPRIRFKLGDDWADYLEVHLETFRGTLRLRLMAGNGEMNIQPQSGNVCAIDIERRQ